MWTLRRAPPQTSGTLRCVPCRKACQAIGNVHICSRPTREGSQIAFSTQPYTASHTSAVKPLKHVSYKTMNAVLCCAHCGKREPRIFTGVCRGWGTNIGIQKKNGTKDSYPAKSRKTCSARQSMHSTTSSPCIQFQLVLPGIARTMTL